MKYCKRCGLITSEDIRICPSCHNELIDYQVIAPPTRKRWLIVVCVVAILVAALLCFLLLTSKEDPYADALTAKIYSELSLGEDLPLSYQYRNAVLNALSFQIEERNEDLYTADVTFTYVDVLQLASSYTASLEDPDAFYQYCIDEINNAGAPTLTKTITVYFFPDPADSSRLIVVDTPSLADVITGGAAALYQESVTED